MFQISGGNLTAVGLKKIHFNSNMKYFSQSNQDRIVDQLLKKKSNGVFIEIGAYDGITFSNSYFFEKNRNWSGICIEPIPEKFKELKKNRNCTVIQGAISDSNEDLEFTVIKGYAEMLSGIDKFRHPLHKKRIEREINSMGGDRKTIKVKCYTLNDLVKKYNYTSIDYLSIDTEGGELDILKSIDFKKFNIKVLSVENNYRDGCFKKHMKTQGFRRVFKHQGDDFFIKEELIKSSIKQIFNSWFLLKVLIISKFSPVYWALKKPTHLMLKKLLKN